MACRWHVHGMCMACTPPNSFLWKVRTRTPAPRRGRRRLGTQHCRKPASESVAANTTALTIPRLWPLAPTTRRCSSCDASTRIGIGIELEPEGGRVDHINHKNYEQTIWKQYGNKILFFSNRRTLSNAAFSGLLALGCHVGRVLWHFEDERAAASVQTRLLRCIRRGLP